MGMSINSTGSAALQQSSSVNNWQQRQTSISSLTSALSSGNLSAAQNAFATLTGSNTANSGTGGTTSTTGASTATGTLAQIGQALQNGDLATAQKLGQTLQSSSSGHHHHGGGHSSSATSSTTASSSNTQATSLNGSGSLINTTA